MEYIIDKNYIENKTMKSHLTGEDKYLIPDPFMMESVKGENLVLSLRRTFEHVRFIPEKIVILRPLTSIVQDNSLRIESSASNMIDEYQTKKISHLFELIYSNIDTFEIERRLDFGFNIMKTRTYLDNNIYNLPKLVAASEEIAGNFSKAELAAFLEHGQANPDFVQKLMEHSFQVFLAITPYRTNSVDTYDQIRNHYMLRFSLSISILILFWIRDEQHKSLSLVKMNNDIVDMIYVALASYFDGILTYDGKMQTISSIVRQLVLP